MAAERFPPMTLVTLRACVTRALRRRVSWQCRVLTSEFHFSCSFFLRKIIARLGGWHQINHSCSVISVAVPVAKTIFFSFHDVLVSTCSTHARKSQHDCRQSNTDRSRVFSLLSHSVKTKTYTLTVALPRILILS